MLRRYPATAITTLIAVALFLLHAYGDPTLALAWQAGAVHGEPWRWFTAHFVHLTAGHLAANAGVALLLAHVADRTEMSRSMVGAWIAAGAGVDLGLLAGIWPITWYAGASGSLYGIAGWLCLRLARTARQDIAGIEPTWAWLAYAALCARVGWSLGTPIGAVGWLGVPAATPAHLYGLVGGSLWALLRRAR